MGKGFTNKFTRDGFSRHTGESRELAEVLGNGSSSIALPEALLFSLIKSYANIRTKFTHVL